MRIHGLRILAVIATFLAFLLVSSAISSNVNAAANGKISGRLINGTTSRPLSGYSVNLYWTDGQTEQPNKSTKTDANGYFEFNNLPTGDNYNYVVYAKYKNVEYTSQNIQLTDKNPSRKYDLKVYETTFDDSILRVESASLVLLDTDKTTQRAFVLETFMIQNPTNKTFLPTTNGPKGPMGLLRFSLPSGADQLTGLGRLANYQMIQTDRGFGTNLPIYPGPNEVTFTYSIPYSVDQSNYNFQLTLPYPTKEFRLLGKEGGPSISSSQLRAGDPVSLWGSRYDLLVGGPFQNRTTLDITFSGLPVNIWTIRPNNPQIWIATAALISLMLALAVVIINRRSRKVSEQALYNMLLAELASLDDKLSEGKLDQETYNREREALKETLINLKKLQSKSSAA